jgi:hypothetical protein
MALSTSTCVVQDLACGAAVRRCYDFQQHHVARVLGSLPRKFTNTVVHLSGVHEENERVGTERRHRKDSIGSIGTHRMRQACKCARWISAVSICSCPLASHLMPCLLTHCRSGAWSHVHSCACTVRKCRSSVCHALADSTVLYSTARYST